MFLWSNKSTINKHTCSSLLISAFFNSVSVEAKISSGISNSNFWKEDENLNEIHSWSCRFPYTTWHRVKYARIRVFSDAYFPVYGQNRRLSFSTGKYRSEKTHKTLKLEKPRASHYFCDAQNPRARKSDFHLYMFFKKLFETFSLIQASHIFNFQTWKRNDLADWVLNTEKGSTIFSNPNNIDK